MPHVHSRLAQDPFQRGDVRQVELVARVIFGNQQYAARIGADAFHRGLDRLHAQRHERGIQVVEAAGEKIGIHRGQLETRVAQVHRRIERYLVLLPLGAQPPFDVRHVLEDAAFEFQQRAGQRGSEVGNHSEAVRRVFGK